MYSKVNLEVDNQNLRGIKDHNRFTKNLVKLNFKTIYIFSDGSWFKSRGKMFRNKVKKYGQPILTVNVDLFDYLNESEKYSKEEISRRESMAQDMHEDVIWIQKMLKLK
jgi:hypothetical protein